MNPIETLKKAITIGGAGTVAMTAFYYLADVAHLPRADFHGLVAQVLHLGTTGTWFAYFVIGIVLAHVYHAYLSDKLPATSAVRGLIFGAILWMAMGLLLMPMMGMGLFAGSFVSAVGMFLALAAYGATVGYLSDH